MSRQSTTGGGPWDRGHVGGAIAVCLGGVCGGSARRPAADPGVLNPATRRRRSGSSAGCRPPSSRSARGPQPAASSSTSPGYFIFAGLWLAEEIYETGVLRAHPAGEPAQGDGREPSRPMYRNGRGAIEHTDLHSTFLRRSPSAGRDGLRALRAPLLVAASPISAPLGCPPPGSPAPWRLLVFAAALLWNAGRARLSRGAVVTAVVLNAAWIVGSVALILDGPLTPSVPWRWRLSPRPSCSSRSSRWSGFASCARRSPEGERARGLSPSRLGSAAASDVPLVRSLSRPERAPHPAPSSRWERDHVQDVGGEHGERFGPRRAPPPARVEPTPMAPSSPPGREGAHGAPERGPRIGLGRHGQDHDAGGPARAN